ncbi:hypothetical protein SAMN04487948_11513 [Halogranum amylolyticum]|uniref:Uncharacterized protein n=1 Tax=Halogranum amylolyticum TaxID=660520 RepID=A0A1H8V9H1_9EURY|nr:hypothetical protein SAMN04487948_11513 [Halogranum amylolyticum]
MAGNIGCECKIGRVSRRRELEDVDEILKESWKAGTSLRDLEKQYNHRVLEVTMRNVGMETLQGEVKNLYQLLTDDDVSPGMRVEAQNRLEQHGIDSDSVTNDFVSYQTIRTHLQNCLEVDTKRESRMTKSSGKNTVLKLLSRTESITNRTIEQLCSNNLLKIGSADVTLSLRVACTDCGEEYSFTRLLERGHCSCSTEKLNT